MTADSMNLLRYWRNSLADMDKLGLSIQEMQAGISVPFKDIQKGQLNQSKIEDLFIQAEEQRQKKINRKKQFQKHDKPEDDKPLPPIQRLPVIISPYKVVKIHEHGQKIAESKQVPEVLPLWLVADLMRTGELTPSEKNVYPWIERRCLTPNETSRGYPIIGDVLQSDEFYTKKADFFEQTGGKPSWNKLFDLTLELFKYVVGENPENVLRSQHYDLQTNSYVRPWNDTHGTSHAIINTYDQYLFNNEQKLPVLLENFCCLNPQPHQPEQSVAQLVMASKRHLAQPQGQFPLSASQRASLNYFFDEKNHSLVTIHGPPGTGKTSLLLSIIASLWVEQALQKMAPPIIVAASINNLAVTNILDHFQSEKRWLPDCSHYCLYLTSDYIKDKADKKKYLFRRKIKGEEPEGVELLYLPEYHLKATEYFLAQFNLFFKKSATDLAYCQNYIHQEMLKIQSKLHKAIDLAHDLYQTQQQITEHYVNSTQLDADIRKQHIEKKRLQNDYQKCTQMRRDWLVYRSNLPRWLKIALLCRSGKKTLRNRIRLYTSQYPDLFPELPTDMETVEAILDKQILEIIQAQKQINQTLTDLELLQIRYSQLCAQQSALQTQLSFNFTTDHFLDFANEQALPAQLDIHLRHELFQLATHYWEALWLQKSIRVSNGRYEYDDRQEYWQIQAMLTPCFVTTLHSGPGFFQYKTDSQEFKTMSNLIDLLIIDEAGQVLPAVAAAMISVAKRALFVGDVKQIEPIAPLSESIDLANAKKFAICIDSNGYKHLKATGILCGSNNLTGTAYGNLIALGQRHTPGMLLKEHRRCAKEIISYCNELCYDDQLVVMTPEKPSVYPRMGYAHIKGIEKRNGSSRSNPLEAEAIVRWIAENSSNICKNCDAKSLDDCIGIITPFAGQVEAIRERLFRYRLRIDKVGTVHSLQGAEKPIIIFSSVYTAEQPSGRFFFDRSPNMLNVAVSRAKMSFLVFGDMDIFDPQKNSPSGLLAKYLFKDENNEINNVMQPRLGLLAPDEIQQITTLERHREVLTAAFQDSIKELNIVSPFLRRNAVRLDNIPELIRQRAPYITINIYTDPLLNQGHRSEFHEVINTLKEAGATVILVKNVHSKIIAIDELIIIEGSFNWLSAAREGRHVREECSLLYHGEKAAQFIHEILQPIRQRAKIIEQMRYQC